MRKEQRLVASYLREPTLGALEVPASNAEESDIAGELLSIR